VINPGGVNAQDEFKKWAVNELRPDLNKGINGEYFDHTSTAAMMLTLFAAENFVANLMDLPADNELITEAVHGVSSTIDSRHFAEEFIRRKRLADKGLVDNIIPKSGSPANGVSGGAGGWSEVAKKGPSKEQPKEEANGNFRVVPGKKRAGKR
jgi:PERQ amino acid-rich with GYF domain-containing protein